LIYYFVGQAFSIKYLISSSKTAMSRQLYKTLIINI